MADVQKDGFNQAESEKTLQNTIEQLEVEKKGLQKRIKDKDKKLQQQETRLIEAEEELALETESTQTKIANQKAIFEHQINDLKRRNTELEEQLLTLKDTQKEGVKLQREASLREGDKIGNLEKDIADLREQLEQVENENYEAVAILKEENKRLKKEVSGPKASKSPQKSDQRQVAKLQVENDYLKKQVEELQTDLEKVNASTP